MIVVNDNKRVDVGPNGKIFDYVVPIPPGPGYVTDGALIILDAGDATSYPGTGTVWYDKSGNSNDFTIEDTGIAYNVGGYFDLTGKGIYKPGSLIPTNSACTFMYIVKTGTQGLFWGGKYQTSKYVGAFTVPFTSEGNKEYYDLAAGGIINPVPGNIPQFMMDTLDKDNIGDYFPDGNWHMVEFKYLNMSGGFPDDNSFNEYPTYAFTDGGLGAMFIYDRTLSDAESLQNYNYFKTTYGLAEPPA